MKRAIKNHLVDFIAIVVLVLMTLLKPKEAVA